MRLNLVGLTESDERPNIVVTAIDANSKTLHTAEVDESGYFDLPDKALKAAHRVVIGPKTDDPKAAESGLRYRASEFEGLVRNAAINIAPGIWQRWRFFFRCVTGTVRLCRRHPWWYYDLVSLATAQPVASVQRASAAPKFSQLSTQVSLRKPLAKSLTEHLYFPYRCQTICNGTVEVYRRTCCCEPWRFDDFRLQEIMRELEEIVTEIPKVPVDPNPPDPTPLFEGTFFKDGALDERAVNAPRDLHALRSLPKPEIADYINARPYLFCRYSCSRPQKIAEGTINPDGRFNICWWNDSIILRRFCHYEYAYIVKQTIFGIPFTIYNGVSAGQWFEEDDDAKLVSYSWFAFACREPGEPGTGAYVYLDMIGDEVESWQLKTPNATGWDRVAAPGYNDGLVFPAPSAAAALGTNLNRNWGGTLKLTYMFSEDMRGVGAKYYRISITEADNNGEPTGTRYYLSDGLAWKKSVPTMTGVDIVPVTLGPFTVGGEDNLYLIPYDLEILPSNWNSHQYHGFLNTNDPRWQDPTKRHLLTVEVFDSTGRRLRPTGTPASGQPGTEITAPFTYRRRYQDLGPTANVPFAALTHMFWWDNQPLTALIVRLNQDTSEYTDECLFLTGSADSTFGVGYNAYHPNPMFQLYHSISWKRGLGGATGYLLPSSPYNVGLPPPPGDSPTNTFGQMLSPRTKCAFNVTLSIWSKTTDGDNLGNGGISDSAAFALEITS